MRAIGEWQTFMKLGALDASHGQFPQGFLVIFKITANQVHNSIWLRKRLQ